jgi:photosystem II stability/assembly factor-like uncharacterized protein
MSKTNYEWSSHFLWSVVYVVLISPCVLYSQPINESLSGVLTWRNIGPYRGGRVTAVTGVPSQPFVYYMGATGGGVWKTEDGGVTWRPISDGVFKASSIGAVAIAESNPSVVYVGMGEACLRSNISHGDGVYKSIDAGKTWTNVGLPDSSQIGKIRIHPENPDIVYVAAVGHPYGPNGERGVFRSRDGGKTWQRILYVNDKTGAVDLSMDSHDPQVIYATMWQVLRTPWGINSVGPGSGIYKTTNGGDTWKRLTNGLPQGDKGKIGVVVSPLQSNRVWATVEAEDGGVYRSDDGGENWVLVNDSFAVRGRQYYYGHIYADPQDLDTVYTFSSKRFFKSSDGGKTFTIFHAPFEDYHDLWIDPHNHLRMIVGNDGGATVTFNGGRSWSTLNNQPTGQFYTVITDNSFPYHIYGAQQDYTTVSIASRSAGPGIDVTDWYSVGGGESGYIAPDPRDPNIVYAGEFWGVMTRYDHRTKEVRNISVWPDSALGRTAAEMKYRFQWTYPIVIPENEPDAIYAGANVLFKSTDQGQSWRTISPDLTRDDKAKESGGRLEEFYSTIFSIAPSLLDKGLIWVGSDDGLVHLTRNGGRDWQDVTPAVMQSWSRINIIEASSHDAGTAYVAVNRYQLDDFRPYIYKTTDFGNTWKLMTAGIPENTFVRVVREDPKRKDLLYAGTETGVYVSFDGGKKWQSLQLNLPVVPITDLAIKEGDLVASTQGRGFWILDDLSPLYRILEVTTSSEMHLFQPRNAYRPGSLVSSEPATNWGLNPPAGVVMYYYFREKPTEPVSLTLEDSGGRIIKTFPSSNESEATMSSVVDVPAKAGMNRFVWDMRYPDAHGIKGGTYIVFGSLRGPVAVPGQYQVRLTAGNQSLIQGFKIKKDPRLDTTQEDFQRQFDLLMAIRDRLSATDDAVNQIHRVRKQIGRSVEQARQPAKLAAAASNLDGELDAVLEELVEPKFTGFDDQMLVFPLKLNARFAALESYVASGDYAPTDQEHAVFDELSEELDKSLAQLEHIMERDVPVFEKLVK